MAITGTPMVPAITAIRTVPEITDIPTAVVIMVTLTGAGITVIRTVLVAVITVIPTVFTTPVARFKFPTRRLCKVTVAIYEIDIEICIWDVVGPGHLISRLSTLTQPIRLICIF